MQQIPDKIFTTRGTGTEQARRRKPRRAAAVLAPSATDSRELVNKE